MDTYAEVHITTKDGRATCSYCHCDIGDASAWEHFVLRRCSFLEDRLNSDQAYRAVDDLLESAPQEVSSCPDSRKLWLTGTRAKPAVDELSLDYQYTSSHGTERLDTQGCYAAGGQVALRDE